MQTYNDNQKLYCSLLFDSFIAQVAAVHDPLLRSRPYVVVRQGGESHKAVVWSASALAREHGIVAGMPLRLALKKCGAVETVHYDEAYHGVVRGELMGLLLRYTPDVAVSRQGRCRLDLSRTPFGGSGTLALAVRRMQKEVSAGTGLERPAAGLAASGVVAGILARLAFPDGIQICRCGGEAELLAGVETRMLPGLTKECRERLRKYGLKIVGQVQRLARADLLARFGGEGERLYCMANGIDIKDSAAAGPAAPLFVETVFERDTGDGVLLQQYLRRTVDRFCHEVRSADLAVRSVLLSIRYTDRAVARKTIVFSRETDDYQTIARRVKTAFDGLYCRRVGLRSFAISGHRLEEDSGQTELFASEWDHKQERLGESIARARDRSGFDAVFSGGDYGAYVKERSSEQKK